MEDLNTTVSVCGGSNISKDDKKLFEPLFYFDKNQPRCRHWLVVVGEQCFNHWFNIPDEELKKILDIFNLLTCFGFMVDDIYDDATVRQNVPVAQLIFGMPSTVSAINYTLSLSLAKVIAFNEPKFIDFYIEHMNKTLRGFAFDIDWKTNFRCPTEEEYYETAIGSIAEYGIMMCRMMEVFSDFKADFSEPLRTIAIANQVANDYINLSFSEYAKGKCDDITTGNFTFPIIHAIHSRPKHNKVLAILRLRNKSEIVRKYCISLLKEYGSLDYTQTKLQELAETAAIQLKKFPENPILDEFINELKKPLDANTAKCFFI